MKKLKLDDPVSADFRGLGIVSAEKDYRLCYFFNLEMGLDFDKSITIIYYDPVKNQRKPVACHVHTDPETGAKLFFVKNKQEGFFMAPEMKQADYLFLEPAGQADTLSKLKTTILNIPHIQSCFIIPVQNLKHIDAE